MRLFCCLTISLPLIASACIKTKKETSEPAPAEAAAAATTITADQTLSKLIVSAGDLDPVFKPQVYQYKLAGGETLNNKLSINTAPVKDGVQILINGKKLRSDFTTDAMPLVAGENTFKIELVDGTTTVNRYTLTVNRKADLPLEILSGISTSDGALNPDFSPDTYSYALVVDKDTTVLTLSPLANYPEEATIVINGTSYGADVGSYDVDLHPGGNTVNLEIKGNNGRSRSYTIVVARPSS